MHMCEKFLIYPPVFTTQKTPIHLASQDENEM